MRIFSIMRNSRIRMLPGILGVLLAFVLMIPLAASVLAVPQLPERFQGRITINGIPLPAVVQVSARMSGLAEVFTVSTNASGNYSLLYVKGDDPDTDQKEGAINNDPIQFLVGGVYTAGSTFSNGASTTLDLNINADAATGISQGLSSSAPGVVVVKPNIGRITNLADNSTLNISIGITSYSATVTSGTPDGIQFLTVYGVAPFNSPSFNGTTGVFSVANAASPVQPSNTPVAEVAPILTGNATTSVSLTVSFTAIGAASMPGLNLPEEYSNTITLRRGDAFAGGGITIADSLAIKQYLVSQLTLAQINPLNAASPNHDGASGDKITIADALAIEQYLVGQRNGYYQ